MRKPRVWEAWNSGIAREVQAEGAFELKLMQDLCVYQELRGSRGLRIAEVGAGHSRVLGALAEENDCVTVERFEGHGGGPTTQRNPSSVENIPVFLGEHDDRLETGSFDVVFSISVVEHVETQAQLAAFHSDQLRILKPGGLFLHAIDLYLEDVPNAHQVERFSAYRSWVTETPGVEPVAHVHEGSCRFACDMATNPDNVLYAWGRVAPSLDGMRQLAQSVSLIVGGRRSGPSV